MAAATPTTPTNPTTMPGLASPIFSCGGIGIETGSSAGVHRPRGEFVQGEIARTKPGDLEFRPRGLKSECRSLLVFELQRLTLQSLSGRNHLVLQPPRFVPPLQLACPWRR